MKTRLNLEFSKSVTERLEKLVENSGAGSKTEVIRRALALYETVAERRAMNDALICRSADGTERELIVI